MNAEILKSVLVLVDEIPAGRVATYGQIARLIGRPKNARLVGKILSQSELYGGKHPCYRVVNATGVSHLAGKTRDTCFGQREWISRLMAVWTLSIISGSDDFLLSWRKRKFLFLDSFLW